MASQHHGENEIWAIVPAKRFSEAKTRLAPVLTRSERSQLARAMLHDVMTVLSSVKELAGNPCRIRRSVCCKGRSFLRCAARL